MRSNRASFARRLRRLSLAFAVLALGATGAGAQAPSPATAGVQAPSPATYPGSCTVSLLNQTARVPATGRWLVTAVPGNTGLVRARLTCVDQGVTHTAASAPVAVLPRRTTAVPFSSFDFALPTPRQVEIFLPATPLTQAGQALQATVEASFTNGTSTDVTAAETTLYVTSNPRIATVSPSGLVTAQGSGTVLITVLHEAVLDSASLTVVLAGDDDGDGLPNDYEVTNGLRPNDPADAREDLDGDGLDNLAEFTRGTNPRSADTDGDTLLDGEEVVAGADGFVTNPLLADTDGDGVPDGLERFVGTDPTNSASVDYGAVLSRIDVAPVAFTLIKNTLYPQETSRRVQVVGTLLDGATVDLTARGVAYSTDGPLIAVLDALPGRVIAGSNGTATVTATFAGRTAVAQVTVQSFNPTPLAFLKLPGAANAVRLEGDYAYIASGATGLYVVDISNPAAPTIAGFVDTPGNANDLAVDGGFAYVADNNGLQIVDIADPAAPFLVGNLALTAPVSDVVVRNGLAYVAAGNSVRVVDVAEVSTGAAPVQLSSLAFPLFTGAVRGVALSGNLLVAAQEGGGIQVVDVTNDLAPLRLGGTHTWPQSGVSSSLDVAVRGSRVYVADGYGPRVARLTVIDLAVPSTPVVLSRSEEVLGLSGLAFDRNLLFASDFALVNGVPVWDVDPLVPAYRGFVNFAVPPLSRDDNGNGLEVRDGLLYLVGNRNYPEDNGVTGDAGLHIARYAFVPEDDGKAPTVELTAPLDGAGLPGRRPVTLTATAGDDVRVESVEFFVDGVPVGVDFVTPYQATFTPSVDTAAAVITVRATDVGGNTALDTATVGFLSAALPVVTILAPSLGTVLPDGTDFVFAVDATDDVAVAGVEFFKDGISLGTVSAPPYQVVVPVDFDVAQVTLSAVAHDDIGQTDTAGPRSVSFTPNQPPTVQLLEPAGEAEVVEGLPIAVLAAAFDDAEGVAVRFFVNGTLVFQDDEAPWSYQLLAPAAPAAVQISAVAVDARSVSSVPSAVSVTAVPDPLTTVEGVVLTAEGLPVAGVTAQVLGHQGTTGGNGRFAIPTVPTNQGLLVVSATFAGQLATSAPAFPLGGDVTDVGTVTFQPNQPPTVAFTAPAAGTSVIAGGPIFVAASATDDVAVTKVAFSRNGQLLAEDFTAPFTAALAAPATPGTVLLSAIAYDAWGASSNPATLSVTVIEDQGTAVTGLVTSAEGTPVAGAVISFLPGLGVTGSTGADGRFAISGVPTFGPFLLSAVQDGQIGVAFFEPEADGVTDIGTLVLFPNTPPVANFINPGDNSYALEGSTYEVLFEASDPEEFIAAGVKLYENGLLVLDQPAIDFDGGYSYFLTLPPAPATIELEAIAYDSAGELSAPAVATLAVVALTTVEGLVQDAAGLPAVGAEVWVLYPHLRASSGVDGRFSVPDVPNLPAGLVANAGFDDGAHGESAFFGNGGGITDVGTITLSEPYLEAPYGTLQPLTEDGFVFAPFADGFTFPFQGVARTGVWVNANGNLTFGQADPTNEARRFFGITFGKNVTARIAPLFVDLHPQLASPDGGVFVRQDADRVVVTWYKLPALHGRNSVQAVLFADGSIRFGFGAVAETGFSTSTAQVVVGVTPSGNVTFKSFDWNAGLPMTFGAGQGGNQSFVRSDFDLAYSTLRFTPNGAGGYDVEWSADPP